MSRIVAVFSFLLITSPLMADSIAVSDIKDFKTLNRSPWDPRRTNEFGESETQKDLYDRENAQENSHVKCNGLDCTPQRRENTAEEELVDL